MAIANIELKLNNKGDEKNIVLETGTLRYIDSMIKSFENADSLKNAVEFRNKLASLSEDELKNSKVLLYYVKDNFDKVQLRPIYNDSEPIHLRANVMENEITEIEKARKHLFNSRNQLFLVMFLNHNVLLKTTYGSIKMTSSEYKYAKKFGLSTFTRDGEHRVLIRDVLKYRLVNQKLGVMRNLYEDTLEDWKKYMMGLSQEDLYFYSRELRVLLNEYEHRKIPRKAVYNLNLNRSVIKRMNGYNLNQGLDITKYPGTDSKKKILEDKKSS